MERIRRYYINAVESREKDLRVLDDLESAPVKPVPVLDGFREMEDAELDAYCKKNGLAMNADDLREVVEYFRREGRDPFETEPADSRYVLERPLPSYDLHDRAWRTLRSRSRS